VKRAAARALGAAALLVTARASAEPPPPAEGAPATTGVAAASDRATATPPPPVEEGVVEVRGRKGVKAGQTTFGGAEVRQVPGAFGDAFRVMEALPGVTPMVSGLPFFFVRGAPPGNNGYYLDGVRIPLLYHVGAGPSVIHPGLVEKVDFYPGGYPARYGRFAGGILSGETRRPAEEWHGEGNVRLFDAGALVEAPFADGRGAALVAGRYSYTAALISLAAPEAVLDYWDYQGRVTWKLGDRDRIGLFGFGSYDFFGEKKADGTTRTAFATQFHRLDARWDHELPGRGTMRTAITIGSDATGTEELAGVRDRMIGARMYLEQPVGADVLVRAGADATLDHYDLDVGSGSSSERRSQEANYPPRNDLVVGLHLDTVIQVGRRWEVTPGVRFDLFESVKNLEKVSRAARRLSGNGAVPSVDPRLLSRLRLSKNVTFVSTFGIAHQPPAFFVPIPGLQLGRLDDGLQTSIQTSQGLELALPLAFTLTPTFFYHRYLGLTDFATTCGIGDDSPTSDESGGDCLDKRVGGRTIGLELLLRRSLTQKLTGWISYTLSRTTRQTRTAAYDLESLRVIDGTRTKNVSFQEIAGDFDRTHVLNVIGAYDLGRGWRAGARFYYYTGRPYSRQAFGYTVPPFNEERFPDFYRIDARIEKAWKVGTKGRISVVFEWLNVTLRKEATSVKCGEDATNVEEAIAAASHCQFDYIGPVTIPSLGVEGAF
jgi:TonB-dependent Receptor Plug Domain